MFVFQLFHNFSAHLSLGPPSPRPHPGIPDFPARGSTLSSNSSISGLRWSCGLDRSMGVVAGVHREWSRTSRALWEDAGDISVSISHFPQFVKSSVPTWWNALWCFNIFSVRGRKTSKNFACGGRPRRATESTAKEINYLCLSITMPQPLYVNMWKYSIVCTM